MKRILTANVQVQIHLLLASGKYSIDTPFPVASQLFCSDIRRNLRIGFDRPA